MKLTKKESDRQFISTEYSKEILARKIPKPKFPNQQLAYAWDLIRHTPLSVTEISNLTRCYFDLHGTPEGLPTKTLKKFLAGTRNLTPKEWFVLLTCYGFNVARPAPAFESKWPHERPFKLKLRQAV